MALLTRSNSISFLSSERFTCQKQPTGSESAILTVWTLIFLNNQRVMFCFQYLKSSELEALCFSLTLFYFTVFNPLNDFVYWFGGFSSLSSLLYWPNAKWTLPSQEEKDLRVYTMRSDTAACLERQDSFTRIPGKRCKKCSCFQKIWMLSPSDYKAMKLLSCLLNGSNFITLHAREIGFGGIFQSSHSQCIK